MFTKTKSSVAALAIAMALSGCGGGGGGSASAPVAANPPPVATAQSVTAAGVVTGFSSVFVDGVKYEVESDTVIAVEDEADRLGDDSRLRMGMKVRVRASESAGIRVAERIEYDEDLKGPARDVMPDAMNPGVGSFAVVRQSVIVDGNTIFDDNLGDNNGDGAIDIRDLTLPAGGVIVVEVSGLPTADGFVATRIERENDAAGMPGVPDDEFEIKGFVDAVAADGSSFRINDATFLVVAGAGGTIFEDGLAADGSLVGVFVEVEADEEANGDLLARKVEREDDIGDRNGDGRLDDDDRDGIFEIKGILVSVDTSVDPDAVVIGSTALDVQDASSLVGFEGALIELKGTFDANGVLVLAEVETETENSVRIEDRVAEVNREAGSITTRLGVVVTPTGDSRVEDDVDEDGDHLTPDQFLARVMANDYLEARGFPGAAGVTWTRIEREDDDDLECKLRGPVDSIEGTSSSDFSFVVLGVTIDVSQIVNDNRFEGIGDQPLGRQGFFDALAVGAVVQAESDDQGLGCEPGRLTAREVAFEADDGIVGSLPPQNQPGQERSGTPSDVSANSFSLNGLVITVAGSTFIDDSLIETALGREFDGGDRRFDQLPDGLTLPDLLPGTFPISVVVTADGVALSIEDI